MRSLRQQRQIKNKLLNSLRADGLFSVSPLLINCSTNSYSSNRLYHKTMNFSTGRKKRPRQPFWLPRAFVIHVFLMEQIKAKPCISSIPQELHIINTQCCISSSRRKNTRWRVMRYSPKGADDMHRTLCGDDMPSLRLG